MIVAIATVVLLGQSNVQTKWQEFSFDNMGGKPYWIQRNLATQEVNLRKLGKQLSSRFDSLKRGEMDEILASNWRKAKNTRNFNDIYTAVYCENYYIFRFGSTQKMIDARRKKLIFLMSTKDAKNPELDRALTIFTTHYTLFVKKIDTLYALNPSDRWVEQLYLRRNMFLSAPEYEKAKKVIFSNYREDPKRPFNILNLGRWYYFRFTTLRQPVISDGERAKSLLTTYLSVRNSERNPPGKVQQQIATLTKLLSSKK